MTADHRPPPSAASPVTADQRRAIAAVIGEGADADIVRAIRDARGRTFQRLEFLGDPLLETVEAMVAVVRDHRASDHQATTDAALARQAEQLGARSWLDWDPSEQRMADLVEAVAGAAFVTDGWSRVGEVFATVSAPLPAEITAALSASQSTTEQLPMAAPIDRALATLGSSMLETAATLIVYTADPLADEGLLSGQRRLLHQTRHVAAWAAAHDLTKSREVASVGSDVVETWLGQMAITSGPATATAHAATVLVGGRALNDGRALDDGTAPQDDRALKNGESSGKAANR